MKKIVALLLIAVLLYGCGGDTKTATDCSTRVKAECATITSDAATCADMVTMTCGGGK